MFRLMLVLIMVVSLSVSLIKSPFYFVIFMKWLGWHVVIFVGVIMLWCAIFMLDYVMLCYVCYYWDGNLNINVLVNMLLKLLFSLMINF